MPKKTKTKQIRVRCWIDINGEKFFGPGRASLLQLIEDTGSISEAARAMEMSYKKAWAMIKEMNTKGSKPFVTVQKGGKQGGGATLTDSGRKAIQAYTRLATRIKSIVDKEKDLLKFI